MGVMNKLRDNTGVILWILVFAFGVIWVLQDSGGLDVVGVLGNNIGTVNGEPIGFEEYSQQLDSQVQNYQQQNGDAMPPQMLDQTRDRVFDQLVDQKLREQEMARLGLAVSDKELIDMVQGPDPHPVIKLYFGDGNGGVDRSLLQSFIENPDASKDWIQIEDYLRSERLRTKLDNLVAATVRVSDADVVDEYNRTNRRVDASYIALRFAALPDDSVSVSDRDLKRFYDDHKDEFARKKAWTFRYVTRDKTPTAEDTAAVFADVAGMRESMAEATDDSTFLARNGSSRPYSDAYFRPDELDQAVADAVFADPAPGRVVGPIISGSEVHLVRIKAVRAPEEPAVRARHILFRATEGDTAARTEARTKANDVLRRIRGGDDFAAMAIEFSSDGSAQKGGDLGWFGPGRMVKPFEDAAFGARVGQVVGPVETQFGYHLIEVTERATREVQLADFALPLRPSVATLNRMQEQLDDLQYFATESGGFADEAERIGLTSTSVQIEDEQQFIPGIGNSGTLMTFLADSKVGAVSPVIELDQQFAVGTVEAILPEGFRPFEEVKEQIEPRVKNEKKGAVQLARMKKALESGGFDGLAAAVGSPARTAAGLSFSNMVVPGLGREPKFVGRALGMEEGTTSGVIEGESAVYVIRVTAVHAPAPVSDAEKARLRSQLLSQRQNQARTQWITALRDDADIVDNRRLLLQ